MNNRCILNFLSCVMAISAVYVYSYEIDEDDTDIVSKRSNVIVKARPSRITYIADRSEEYKKEYTKFLDIINKEKSIIAERDKLVAEFRRKQEELRKKQEEAERQIALAKAQALADLNKTVVPEDAASKEPKVVAKNEMGWSNVIDSSEFDLKKRSERMYETAQEEKTVTQEILKKSSEKK